MTAWVVCFREVGDYEKSIGCLYGNGYNCRENAIEAVESDIDRIKGDYEEGEVACDYDYSNGYFCLTEKFGNYSCEWQVEKINIS